MRFYSLFAIKYWQFSCGLCQRSAKNCGSCEWADATTDICPPRTDSDSAGHPSRRTPILSGGLFAKYCPTRTILCPSVSATNSPPERIGVRRTPPMSAAEIFVSAADFDLADTGILKVFGFRCSRIKSALTYI